MAGCCGPKCSKAFVIFFNILFWFSGCALVALGVILLYDQMYQHVFNLMAPDIVPKNVLQFVAFGCVGLGGVILFVGFFGCCGALQDSKCMLGTYVFFLILVFLIEAAATLMGLCGWFYFPDSVRTEMHTKQRQEYGTKDMASEVFTESLDYIQYEFECCGVYNISDWKDSAWHVEKKGENRNTGQRERKETNYPMSCCTVDKKLWRDEEEPWKKPDAKNAAQCQGRDHVDNADYVYQGGCLPKLMEWYYKQQLCLTPALGGLAFLQIIGVVFSICLIRNIGEEA